MSWRSRKNQVTLPAAELATAELRAGDEVEIRVAGRGGLEVVRRDDLVVEFAGICDGEDYPPGYRDMLRDEWR